MAGEFLPPVVTRFTGDISDLTTAVAQARALIASIPDRTIRLSVRTDGISGPVRGAIAQINALRDAMAGLDDRTVRIGVAGPGGAGAGLVLGGLRLTGTALHWLISGFAELAAVAIPATIAIAAWAAVWSQGAQNVQQHLQAVYTTAESVANIGGQTAGQMLGLGHALQTAQNAANPNVYQALGAAIQVVREHAGGLTSAGLQLGRVFDTFMARVVSDFGKGGSLSGPLDALTAHMVQDATGIGQVFGNLGHILLSFASQMPGLAEVLLGTLSGVLRLGAGILDLASKIRIGGASVLTLVMGFEEFNRWGGLAATLLTRIGFSAYAAQGGFFTFARMASVVKALLMVLPAVIANAGAAMGLMIPRLAGAGAGMITFSSGIARGIGALSTWQVMLVAVAAVGLGLLIDKIVTAKDGIDKLTEGLQAAADRASNLNVLNVLASNMAQLGQVINSGPGAAMRQFGRVTSGAMADALNMVTATGRLTSALNQQQQQFVTVASHAAFLANAYHTSLTGALLLADQAGVKLNQTLDSNSWGVAQLKIANLVQGFRSMGAPIGAAGNDVLMLGIQSGLAATQVSKVNQAADQFLQNLTGGTTAVATFNQSMTNMGAVIGRVQENLGQFTGHFSLSEQKFASSLNSFTGKGAQAWINFNQVVGSTAPQIVDWLRTAGAEGTISGSQFTRAVLAMTGQLVPFASKSRTAQAELLGLAQSAGLNVKTWPDLISQIRAGHVSAGQLAQIVGEATAKMGSMAQVAQNLGSVLQSSLIQTMDASKIQASGVAQATLAFERSVMNSGGAVDATNPKYVALMGSLAKLGYSAGNAKGLIKALADQIANVPTSHTTTFYLRTVGNVPVSSIPIGGGGHIRNYATGGSAPPGWAMVGEAGPELVHFGSGGGQVIPNHMLSSGGSPHSSGGSSVTEIRLFLDGREIFPAIQRETHQYNVDNGNRDGRGRVRGVLVPR